MAEDPRAEGALAIQRLFRQQQAEQEIVVKRNPAAPDAAEPQKQEFENVPHTVTISIMECRALWNRDPDGSKQVDPFIKVFSSDSDDVKNVDKWKDVLTTPVVHDTVNPKWKHGSEGSSVEVTMVPSRPECSLFFEVWNYDLVNNDFLGALRLTAKEVFQLGSGMYALALNAETSPNADEEAHARAASAEGLGFITLRVNVSKLTTKQSAESDASHKVKDGQHPVTVFIARCDNLLDRDGFATGVTDPFVRVVDDTGAELMITPTHDNTVNPIWDPQESTRQLHFNPDTEGEKKLKFQVWNWNATANDFLGEAVFSVKDIFAGKSGPRTVLLCPRADEDDEKILKAGKGSLGNITIFFTIPDDGAEDAPVATADERAAPATTSTAEAVRVIQGHGRTFIAKKSVQNRSEERRQREEVKAKALAEAEAAKQARKQRKQQRKEDEEDDDSFLIIKVPKKDSHVIKVRRDGVDYNLSLKRKDEEFQPAPPILRAALKELIHLEEETNLINSAREEAATNAMLLVTALKERVNKLCQPFNVTKKTSTEDATPPKDQEEEDQEHDEELTPEQTLAESYLREKLLMIEAGCYHLLRETTDSPAFAPKPTMLQVVYNSHNSEVDVVRRVNDSTLKTTIERLPISLHPVIARCDEVDKKLRENEETYLTALQEFEDVSAAVEADEADDDDLHPLRIKLRESLIQLHDSRLAAGQWRENKAVLQFALEVMHTAEAGELPISADKTRLQPLEMLRMIRSNINHLEEILREAGRQPTHASPVKRKSTPGSRLSTPQPHSTNGSSRRLGPHSHVALTSSTMAGGEDDTATVTHHSPSPSSHGGESVSQSIDKVQIYRDLEVLRNNEAVLEACLAEKKQLLGLIHRDRLRFVEQTQDSRALLKEKDKEVMRAAAQSTENYKKWQETREDNKKLRKQLTEERQRIEDLRDHLEAVKEKRRTGGGGSPSPASPYKIAVDNAHAHPITDERTKQLLHRLYDRELHKIKNPKPLSNSLVTPVEPIEIEEFNKRMYYERRDRAQKQEEKLRKKFLTAQTPPPVSKEKVGETVDRLAVKQIQETKERQQQRFQKIVLSQDPVMAKRTEEERKTIIERLYVKKSS